MDDASLVSARAAEGIPGLRALLVIAMPDCLLYDSWHRAEEPWQADEVASYIGDLTRANRETLKILQAWSSDMLVTIESAQLLLILKELSPDFVCGAVFETGTPLGMVRLNLKKIAGRLIEQLPTFEVEQRPRASRVVEFLQRYAPDPHAVLLRTSLRTGIPIEKLQKPELLSDDEAVQIEDAAKRILGLRQLSI